MALVSRFVFPVNKNPLPDLKDLTGKKAAPFAGAASQNREEVTPGGDETIRWIETGRKGLRMYFDNERSVFRFGGPGM